MRDQLPKPRLQKGQKYCKGCGTVISARSANGGKRTFCTRTCYDEYTKRTQYDREKYSRSSTEHTLHLFNVVKNHTKRIAEIQTFKLSPQAKAGALYREDRLYKSALKELNTIGKSLTPSQKRRYTPKLKKIKKFRIPRDKEELI